MNVKNLIEILSWKENAALHIMLPSGEFVPENFHITEIGRVHKTFVDCGGVKREQANCTLQVWTANDKDHRLFAGKLLKIFKFTEEILGSDDLPVAIEYGSDVASLYFLQDVEVTPGGLLLTLAGKQTECLAPDKCGVTGCC